MIRRMQLLGPEQRPSSTQRLAALLERIRDELPRDARIVPAVLGVLALFVFAWLAAGLFVGDPGQEEQQASNQASLAQDDSNGGGPETPAPGVENRDTDSYAEFGEPRDPFRPIIPKAGEDDDKTGTGKADSGKAGNDKTGSGTGGNGKAGNGGSRDNGSRNGGGFIDQTSPGDSDTDRDDEDRAGDTDQAGDAGQGGGAGQSGGAGQPGGGTGQGGTGNLFDSGGDLALP